MEKQFIFKDLICYISYYYLIQILEWISSIHKILIIENLEEI